jgi:hypothetical protein
MSRLKELERTVAALPKAELDQFADWFDGLRAAQWDAQVEIDADNVNVNALADSALLAHRNGQSTPL